MSRAAAAQASKAMPNLYLVTINNLDGTTKTVLKWQPLQGAISNYELTPQQINAHWLAGQADLPGNRGPIPSIIRRRIALFTPHNRTDLNSKKLSELDGEQKEHARRVALALNLQDNSDFLHPAVNIADDVLDAALNGDEAICKMMLEKNAGYLLYRGTASDFSDRQYDNLTPFQAALITGDDKMAEMMKPYFDRLPNGQAEMQKQVTEIFPNGIEAHIAAQERKSETDFSPMLEEVIAAINNASHEDLQAALNNECNNSRLYLVLNKFRAAFDSLSRSEKIFNPQHLLKAFEAYVNKFDWNTPIWNKLDLFWRQVIGFVQRFLPATYAQAFAYSLYDTVEEKHSCPRSFNFRDDSGFSFYPLAASCSGIGFNFAVGRRRLDRRCDGASGWRARVACLFFAAYIEQKNIRLSEHITQRAQSTHSCVMQ